MHICGFDISMFCKKTKISKELLYQVSRQTKNHPGCDYLKREKFVAAKSAASENSSKIYWKFIKKRKNSFKIHQKFNEIYRNKGCTVKHVENDTFISRKCSM
jgi:hypothetical protein